MYAAIVRGARAAGPGDEREPVERNFLVDFRRLSALALTPEEIVTAFQERFQTDVRPAIYRAPGRVNLIGEHTDYNLATYSRSLWIWPATRRSHPPTERYWCIRAILRRILRFQWRDRDAATRRMDRLRPRRSLRTEAAGLPNPGAVHVWSTVPGSGLSSSAALEISSALPAWSRPWIARACQARPTRGIAVCRHAMRHYGPVHLGIW